MASALMSRAERIRSMETSWRKFFSDPSQWFDDRNRKTNPRAPDFRHKSTDEPLWIDGWYNPPWVYEELRRIGVATEVTKRKNEVEANAGNREHEDMAKSFVALLKSCAQQKDLQKGSTVHTDILNTDLLEKNQFVGNALISMYAKCGAFAKAQEVLERLPFRNVVSWSALIAGYAQDGRGQEALDCYKRMCVEHLSLNAVTCISLLKACGTIAALDEGEQLHDTIVRQRFLEGCTDLGGALVDMYVKCGALAKAAQVLKQLPVRHVGAWSALMAGYARQGHSEEALHCLELMQHDGLCPDAVTFGCILKACETVEKGELLHTEIVKQGLLGKSPILGGALVAMYAKCGALAEAAQVLRKLPARDAVSWSTLVAGYAQNEQGKEALTCFAEMLIEGLSPNAVTFACVLKACGSLGELDKGKQIHGEIARQGLLQTDIVLGGALIDMYAKCGALSIAHEVLESLCFRNVVTWSALIAGYAQKGHGVEALECFEQMQREGLSPDATTFVCILKACGTIGAIEKGEKLHSEARYHGLLGRDIAVGNALLDMYAKCGTLAKAQEVLNELPERDVVSWTSLIAGYAQQGQAEEALDCFKQMQREGVTPSEVTFACVLNACSHAGLLEAGRMYFTKLSEDYGIVPDPVHHSCMVDLFGRAGHFNEAIAVIKKMPCSNHVPVWSALLGACRKWGNVDLGRFAFDHAIQLDRKDASAYVCMSNLYEAASMREEAIEVEAMRQRNGAREEARTELAD